MGPTSIWPCSSCACSSRYSTLPDISSAMLKRDGPRTLGVFFGVLPVDEVRCRERRCEVVEGGDRSSLSSSGTVVRSQRLLMELTRLRLGVGEVCGQGSRLPRGAVLSDFPRRRSRRAAAGASDSSRRLLLMSPPSSPPSSPPPSPSPSPSSSSTNGVSKSSSISPSSPSSGSSSPVSRIGNAWLRPGPGVGTRPSSCPSSSELGEELA